MDAQLHPDLQQALALSAQMLQAAHDGDWALATARQAECDRLMRQAPVNAAGLMALRQLYREQQELLALVEQSRAMLEHHLAGARVNHRAVSAYIDTSGGS